LVVAAVRAALAHARQLVRDGGNAWVSDQAVMDHVQRLSRPSLQRVINATGVVLHTNLGRAPLAKEALRAALEVGGGYSNLEFDLAGGQRGSRYDHVKDLLCELLNVEDALVVNNCAAALLLALSTHCSGRTAVVSRGELVEIGGGFRIPDVIRQGGARLLEVGTTNRTRLSDYESAISLDTGVLLKVHQSNFALIGFTESVPVNALAQLAAERNLPVMVDLGSGRLADLGTLSAQEPSVQDTVKAGASVVTFSGDKLLGGPQAGVLVGKSQLIAPCREHPLCRALRVDKLTLAALGATLRLQRDGRQDEIPAVRMLNENLLALRERAESLLGTGDLRNMLEIVNVSTRPGGGTLPQAEVASVALSIRPSRMGADALCRALREAEVPVVARIEENAVLLDLRTVLPEEDVTLREMLEGVLSGRGRDGEVIPC
jgi:L-seryl-tRNA(Ser) seleniumtransferase